MNYGFAIDNRKCIGCHACTVACKSEHDIPIGVNRTHVKYVEKGVFPHTRRSFTVTRCNHCESAPCTEICPTSALFTRRDGIVDFDSERCIACKSCMQACPYDALYIDPATQTAAKCNYCAHRIETGYEPACVIVCPVEAIVSGDLDDPESRLSQLVSREQVTVRKPEKDTRPNVFYIDGDHESLNPSANPRLDSYLFSDQAAGVGHFAGRAEDWLSSAAEKGLFLPAGEDSGLNRAQGGVSLAGGISISQRAVDDVRREIDGDGGSRRVYDTPDKGVLWGWQVSAYIWTKAVSTGTFMLAVLTGVGAESNSTGDLAAGFVVSLVFLALTAALLVIDLDRPERFLYVIFRPNWKSWLVRGAYIISAFGAVVALMLASLALGWPAVLAALRWPGFALAALGAIYTAFLLAQAKGRDLWQSPVAAIRMLNHAFMAGAAAWILIKPSLIPDLAQLLVYSIGFNLLLLLLEFVTPHASADAAQAARLVLTGRCGLSFFTGVALGSILPWIAFALAAPQPLIQVAAILTLGGIYLTEYAWVRAPQLIPLA